MRQSGMIAKDRTRPSLTISIQSAAGAMGKRYIHLDSAWQSNIPKSISGRNAGSRLFRLDEDPRRGLHRSDQVL